MKHFYIPILLLASFNLSGQVLPGFYSSMDSSLSLNLNEDSSFNYFYWKEGGYAGRLINRSGRFEINNDTLILKSIILNDTLEVNDTFKLIIDKNLDYEDYFELKSEFYNDRPDICIWVDDSLLLRFPDTKFYINYDFGNRLYPNDENKIIFEYPKETNLYYINLRSIYYKIEIDFYNYYKLIDVNNWHVEKNLLHLKMKRDLLNFKRDNFQVFARFKIDGNKLILVDARDPDFSTMKLDSMTHILDKKN